MTVTAIPKAHITLDQYATPLGEGGTAKIFLAKYHNSMVAVKVIKLTNKEQALEEAIRNESAVWERLRHPNILQFYGLVENPLGFNTSLPLMVMEYASLGDLHNYIEAHKTSFNTALASSFAVDIANGMHYLHSLETPIIHGDLKPLNVLIANNGELVAKLTDFGFAKVKSFNKTSTSSSRSGTAGGTLCYMAPERMEGKKMDLPSDVYSFAMTLYQLFSTGVFPFELEEFESEAQVVAAILLRRERPRRPADRHHIPDDAWTLIERCWNNDPNLRPRFDEIVAAAAELKSRWNGSAAAAAAGVAAASSVADAANSKVSRTLGNQYISAAPSDSVPSSDATATNGSYLSTTSQTAASQNSDNSNRYIHADSNRFRSAHDSKRYLDSVGFLPTPEMAVPEPGKTEVPPPPPPRPVNSKPTAPPPSEPFGEPISSSFEVFEIQKPGRRFSPSVIVAGFVGVIVVIVLIVVFSLLGAGSRSSGSPGSTTEKPSIPRNTTLYPLPVREIPLYKQFTSSNSIRAIYSPKDASDTKVLVETREPKELYSIDYSTGAATKLNTGGFPVSARVSHDLKRAYAVANSSTITEWDLTSFRSSRSWTIPTSFYSSFGTILSSDDRYLYFGGNLNVLSSSSFILVLDTQGGTFRNFNVTVEGSKMFLSSDDQLLFITNGDTPSSTRVFLAIYNTQTGALVRQFVGAKSVQAMAAFVSKNRLYTFSSYFTSSSTLDVWDLSGANGNTSLVSSSISTSQSYYFLENFNGFLYTSGTNYTTTEYSNSMKTQAAVVKLSSAADENIQTPLRYYIDPYSDSIMPYTIALSPDGKYLFTATYNGTVLMWDA
ncbi:kinase-like domain-containing protein [Cladochytrium replicatum]|nr:kinase-like domain-containing protein [Cladochytrium replicatum]